jgi:hypothetical protein
MEKWQKKKIPIRNKAEKEPVPIVSDGAVATQGTADGRIIPVLIIDTSLRPDIEDMIQAHKHIGAGDVKSAWSVPSRFNIININRISLVLTIIKPSRCLIIIEFNIVPQGGVVDQIIQAQGVYIQPGKEGDRLRTTMDHDRILVEVPSKHFRTEWDKILYNALAKDFKRKGLSRSDAKIASKNFIKEWRNLRSMRIWPV